MKKIKQILNWIKTNKIDLIISLIGLGIVIPSFILGPYNPIAWAIGLIFMTAFSTSIITIFKLNNNALLNVLEILKVRLTILEAENVQLKNNSNSKPKFKTKKGIQSPK